MKNMSTFEKIKTILILFMIVGFFISLGMTYKGIVNKIDENIESTVQCSINILEIREELSDLSDKTLIVKEKVGFMNEKTDDINEQLDNIEILLWNLNQ